MTSDTDWLDEPPWGLEPQRTPEERLGHRYNELVAELMSDYQASYSPGAARNEWLMAPGGENDPYGGPFYGTAAEAEEAAAYHLAQAEAASADLPAATAALREQAGYVEKLRAELDGCRPWQRYRREQLRGRIAEAQDVLEDRYSDVSHLELLEEWSPARYGDAAWIRDVLRRYERARHTAQEAAARAMGWRPGQPATASAVSRPHALGSSGQATTASGNRTPSTRPRSGITDPARHAATAPPLMHPPQQAARGPIARM